MDNLDIFGPDTTVSRAPEDRPDIEPKKIKAGVKKKSPGSLKRFYEGLSRDAWREVGYHVDRCSNENSFTGKSHDLFGFADLCAIGNGEIVFIQVTSKDGISGHKKKFLTADWSVTNGYRYLTLASLRLVMKIPSLRVVIEGWHQPNGPRTKWECEQIQVTDELLDQWLEKRARRSA